MTFFLLMAIIQPDTLWIFYLAMFSNAFADGQLIIHRILKSKPFIQYDCY
jgi:hypothetical protein